LSFDWIRLIADSRDAALVLSLAFNIIAIAAIRKIWKSREALGDRVTEMLMELLRELTRMNR